jgi:Rad3-related DNA helicase
VGRLIRTSADTGIVVVLDRRIAEKWYGRWFLRSIPECPVEVVEVPGPLEETGATAGGEEEP